MGFLKGFVTSVDKVNRAMYWIVAAITFLATALVFIDVILRYLFRTVTPFGYDASLWFTMIIGLLTCGYITQVRGHITVDILYLKMGQKARLFVRCLVYAVTIFTALVMLVYGTERVMYYLARGTKSIGGMQMHLWTKWLIVPISGALLMLQALAEMIKDIYYQAKGSFLVPPTPKMLEDFGVEVQPDTKEEGE